MESQLSSLFNPSSIAVVGVSTNPSKLGTVIFHNILDAGYEGAVFPVNPKYDQIEDRKAFSKVSEIEGDVDLVVVVIPAPFVLETVRDCVSKGVKNCVIISAGFGEVDDSGRKLELEVARVASEGGMRVLGPNCLGLSVPTANLDASFAAQMPLTGNIAFLSQSGAFNTAMLDMAAVERLGFSHFVSLGNKVDLNELDFLKEWMEDPKVEVIGMYIEEFANGRDFVDLVSKSNKPVVILHPGESEEAQEAIASHTGSLAGSSEVVHSALQKAGALQVHSIEKMFNLLKALARAKSVTGDKVAVLTNAGGPGIMVTDMLIENKISLPELSGELRDLLAGVLPDAASTHNPIDLIGDALASRYSDVLELIDKSSEVDSILIVLTPQHVTQIEETSKVLINYHLQGSKPLIVVYLGAERVGPGLDLLHGAKVPAFNFAEEAVFALGKLREFSSYHNSKSQNVESTVEHNPRLQELTTDESKALSQELVHEITQGLAFDLPKEETVSSFQQAVNFVSENDFPVVLKASTTDIAHKTEEKALYLGLDSMDKLEHAFTDLQATISKVTGNKEPALLIQQQVGGGEELIIGVKRDGGSDVYEVEGKGFGHLLLVGKGGIYTEVYNDTAFGLFPLSRNQMLDIVLKTNVSKILVGSRNMPGLAIEKLLDTLEAMQTLVMRHPEIDQLDINPAILTPERCISVDIKVFVKK